MYCATATAVMREAPRANAIAVSEVLFGEEVQVLDDAGSGFVEARSTHDDYTGFIDAGDLAKPITSATHRVSARSTLVFPEPGVKYPPIARLPFTARVSVMPGQDGEAWLRDHDGRWLYRKHLIDIASMHSSTPHDLAHAVFADAPYLWGGRTPEGCDCSGLVQVTHAACGIALPRDSGDQEDSLTNGPDDQGLNSRQWQAGDLVFWPGHVAFLVDTTTVRHANAHSLSVVDEPLNEVIARAGPIRSVRRPSMAGSPIATRN